MGTGAFIRGTSAGDVAMGKGTGAPGTQSTLNDQVKARADALVGQPTVGNKECYDLADHALKKAGAKSAPDFGAITADADYRWGTPVADLKLVQPGDILQFRDHEVEVATETTTTEAFADGSWKTDTESKTRSSKRGHHTAIVSASDGAGVLTVVEQHVMNPATGALSTTVRKNTLHTVPSSKTETKKSTRLDGKKRPVQVEVVTTVTVSVKGTIWAYRPTK
jgi:hypothetical protein